MKRIISLLLSFVICLGMLPANPAQAAALPFTDEDFLREDFSFKDYKEYIVDSVDKQGYKWPEGTKAIMWEIESGGKNINKKMPVQLPDDIEIIGDCAFMNREDVSESVIDFSRLTELRYIGDNAFRDTKIMRADLSKTKVVRIGEMAFNTQTLTHFIAPSTLKRIDDHAFGRYCRIAHIELNEGLEYIGEFAFGMNKTTIKLPSTIKHIGYAAFSNTDSFVVYKGTYGEEWCKANGKSYTYAKTEAEIQAEKEEDAKYGIYPDISHRVGPVKINKYLTHSVNERVSNDGERALYFRVLCTEGVSVETLFDKTEIYYTPFYKWNIEGEKREYAATADTTSFLNYRKGPALISDYNINITKTDKLDFGWSKGLKWEFYNNDIGFGDPYFIAEYNGVKYFYELDMGWKQDYQKALCKQDYDKKGFFGNSKSDIKATDTIIIADGKEIKCKAYNINNNNYFMLRDVAMFLNGSSKQFNVGWNEKENAVELASGKEYIPSGVELELSDGNYYQSETFCPSPVFKDGKEIVLKAYVINGNNYVRLRDVGRTFNFGVSWDEGKSCIVINSDIGYSEE